MSLNTPARAARVQRPQTRAWKRLLSEANDQTANSLQIRAQLRQHLQAAERLAANRASKKPSLEVLESLKTDWNIRVEVLTALREDPSSFDIRPIVPWLVLQLGELRSAVVVATAAAITSISSQKLFSPEQVKEIFTAAAHGANVSKKVMASARKQAAMTVLHDQTDKVVYDAVTDVINSSHSSVRIVAAEAFVKIVGTAHVVTQVEEYVIQILGKLATDKDSKVREAARNLKEVVEKQYGVDECARILCRLPPDSARRLKGSGVVGEGNKAVAPVTGVKGKKSLAEKNTRPSSIKALIRERKKAKIANMTSQKEGVLVTDASTIKGRGTEAELCGVPDPKKIVIFSPDKENRPNLPSA